MSIKDGWHNILGNKVLIIDGFVKRGLEGDGFDRHATYPYRYYKKYGWTHAPFMTVDAFRAAVKRGNAMMK